MKTFRVFEQHTPKSKGGEFIAQLEQIIELTATDFKQAIEKARKYCRWPIVQQRD